MTRHQLREALKVHHGWAFPSSGCRPPIGDGSPRLIRIGDFAKSRRSVFEAQNVQEYVGDYRPRFELKPGELLVAMTCQTADGEILGYPMRVPDDGILYLHNQRIGRVEITNPRLLDLDYTEYLFRSPDLNWHLASTASGSKILHTSPDRIERWSTDLPSLEEQRRIAGVLGALDDLIDTNTQLADQMDCLLSTAVQDALDRAEESEPLSTYADFVNGRNFTKGADGTGRPVIRTPEVRLGPSGSTPRSSIDAVDANVARSGDTLFVWSGSLTLGRWRWEDGLVNQHVFKVIPRAGTPDWLSHQLIQRQLPWFLSLAADKATTMGHIQRRHLDARVPALKTSVLSRLDEIAGPLWAASLDARTEADRLAGVRDELLPLLMSGQITVDEAWEAVS